MDQDCLKVLRCYLSDRGPILYALWRTATVLCLLFSYSPATLAEQTSRQVWLIDTRAVCNQTRSITDNLQYYRVNDSGCLTATEAPEFYANLNLKVPIVVFVPGNRTDIQDALQKGLFAESLIRSSAGDRPFRFVIWSWPAEKMLHRPAQDIRYKFTTSDDEGYYLAQWLHTIKPGAPVSLVGHSLGARIICAALHLLAGGEFNTYQLPIEVVNTWKVQQRNPVRVMLLVPAMDAGALTADGEFSQALSLVDKALISYNSCDRVLKWYPKLYGRCGPQAAGFTGAYGLENAQNVEQINICCETGKRHNCLQVCVAPAICSRWAKYTFLE